MTQPRSGGGTSSSERTGEDFVCSTCGCEVMVKHWGDPQVHAQIGTFLCHCGTAMQPEHGSRHGSGVSTTRSDNPPPGDMSDDFLREGHGTGQGPSSQTGRGNLGDDLLREGRGAPEATERMGDAGDGNMGQDDGLGAGSGAGTATGMGRTSSTSSSPGGGL